MKKYAEKFMELAPRDITSRAIMTEIEEGGTAGAIRQDEGDSLELHAWDLI